MKKSIILYNPKAVFFDMPLALISIGTQVQDDFEVVIIDARVEDDPEGLLAQHIDNALLLGVTSLTGAPLKDAISFSEKAKALRSDIPIVWGGWHTSLFPEQVLKDVPEIDIAVQGQGEIVFKEIVEAISNKSPISEIKGIVLRNGDEIIKTPPRLMAEMNDLPRLNYDLIDVERYFKAKGSRQFDFITSIGCFFRCTFCADPFVFSRKFSSLNPERVSDDLKYYHDKYQFTDLNFQDETFFTYPKNILRMAELLVEFGSKFTWAATMRADQGSRMSVEQFRLLKESGLRRLLIGVESGSQEMMDWLKKDIKIEQVLECAERCKELEIGVIFPFIVGFPKETDKSIEASKEMIRKLAFMSPYFETPIFYFKPYPGTKITDDVVKSGEYTLPVSLQEWSDFDYIGSKGPWVNDQKFAFFEKYKFYLRLAKQRKKAIYRPFAYLAMRRIKSFNFTFPIEKKIIELVRPKKELS